MPCIPIIKAALMTAIVTHGIEYISFEHWSDILDAVVAAAVMHGGAASSADALVLGVLVVAVCACVLFAPGLSGRRSHSAVSYWPVHAGVRRTCRRAAGVYDSGGRRGVRRNAGTGRRAQDDFSDECVLAERISPKDSSGKGIR